MKNIKQLDDILPFILFAYWTSKQSIIRISPFYLTYKRIAVLSVDLNECNEDSEEMFHRINELINDLSIKRKKV